MTSSNYDPSYVRRYYDRDPEREWARLVRSPLEEIKLHIHDHYLRAHLVPGMRVLDIGAGPGRFMKTLHEIGCSIVVADISSQQLDANKAKARESGFGASVERWIQLDVCDLAELEAGSFDAVVAYGGPISYVFERAEDALRECSRILKPNGYLLTSVMSLWGTLHRFFRSVLELPVDSNSEIVRTGNLTPETDPSTDHFFHMFRADELQSLLADNGFRVIAISASNCLSTAHDVALETVRKDTARWDALLRWELEACASSGNIEAGTHMIAVGEKQSGT